MSPRRALVSDVLWSVVAVLILVAGFAGFRTLGALKEPIVAAPVERTVPTVEVAPLARRAGPVPVVGEGFVRAAREVTLAAERGGRVVEVHPAVRALGAVRAGETLVRLDGRDAEAALLRAESDIASTQARLALNTTQLERTRTLRRRGAVSEDALDTALSRQSELEGALASAESAKRSAEVALDATRILAPFDGRILSGAVEVGAVAGAGQGLAELASVDALEVTVALDEAGAALVPGLFEAVPDGAGAPASVRVDFAGRTHAYPARVTHVAPALDAATRTLDVTVGLTGGASPFEGADGSESGAFPAGVPPALINAWATVAIDGAAPPALADALHAVPASAVRERDTLWLVADGTLRIVGATVVRVEDDVAWVHPAEVPDGAALVTSVLPAPVDGMAVAVVAPKTGTEDEDADGAGADTSRTASSRADAGDDARSDEVILR